jgi:predicted HicB family RNase H-like nuclease
MPAKETDKQFLLRTEHELFNDAKVLAKIEYKSVNQLINQLLGDAVEKNKKRIKKHLVISK